MSTVNILHLSDLHYGVQDADGGSKDVVNLHVDAMEGLCDALCTIPEKCPDWKPDVIAITGDVAWAAKESDYKQAAVFIKRLLDMFGLAPEDVVLCPGNHDVDRELNTYTFQIQSLKHAEKHLSVEGIKNRSQSFENFAKFSEGLGIPQLKNSTGDKIVQYLYGYRDIKGIRFVVFNTAWNVRSREPNEEEILWIGPPLTNDVFRKDIMTQSKNLGNDLIITLFHHPFRYLDDAECYIYDQRRVVAQVILKASDIILNGHVHGEIREATFTENKAHTFISSTAFEKGSSRKGCQIIRIDRSRRCYSTKVIRYNDCGEWEVKDFEADVPLDPVTAQEPFRFTEKAVRPPPEAAGWWLPPDWDPEGPDPLPIDDGASQCLTTFLLARTDPYVVVLASDAEIRLAELLREESRRESADTAGNASYMPRTWVTFQGEGSFKGLPGIVVSLSDEDSQNLGAVLEGYGDLRGQAPDAAIVYCVWSNSLKAAAGRGQRLANELRKQVPNVDVMALSVRKELHDHDAGKEKEAVSQIEAFNRQDISSTEEVNELLRIRDNEPELWPYVLRSHAVLRSGKYRILGFAAACHTQTDVEAWFRAVKTDWFQAQGVELNPFADLLCREEARRLVWGLYQKVCSERNEQARQAWDGILDAQLALAPSVADFLSLLKGQEVGADAICPEDASQWARNAPEEEFQRLVPELRKQSLPVYWAALLASPYGRPYVRKELFASEKMQLVLNADAGKAEDPHWREQLSGLRRVSRPYQ